MGLLNRAGSNLLARAYGLNNGVTAAVARSMADDPKLAWTGIRGVALRNAAIGASVGGAYGGVNNPDGNHLGGAISGAFKGGIFGGVAGGASLAGLRTYGLRSSKNNFATLRPKLYSMRASGAAKVDALRDRVGNLRNGPWFPF